MSAPSDKAKDAAHRQFIYGEQGAGAGYAMAKALEAAHSPSLGIARSVCLQDVLDALEEFAPQTTRPVFVDRARRYIERTFTEDEPSGQ